MTREERFWAKVKKTESCWLWTGAHNAKGYGGFWMGFYIKAHQASYRLFRGPIPKGMHVLHTCDNPPCVRPDHLWLGTNAENHADAARKRRFPYGEQNSRSKLTEPEVVQILRSREPHASVARQFGVSASAVVDVRQKRTWRHIDIPVAYYEENAASNRRPNQRGEKNGSSKLTESDVREIRELAATGTAHAQIATRFEVSGDLISRVVSRKAWRHVE